MEVKPHLLASNYAIEKCFLFFICESINIAICPSDLLTCFLTNGGDNKTYFHITISMTNLLVTNPLEPGAAFLYPPKTSERNVTFSDVLRRFRQHQVVMG